MTKNLALALALTLVGTSSLAQIGERVITVSGQSATNLAHELILSGAKVRANVESLTVSIRATSCNSDRATSAAVCVSNSRLVTADPDVDAKVVKAIVTAAATVQHPGEVEGITYADYLIDLKSADSKDMKVEVNSISCEATKADFSDASCKIDADRFEMFVY